MSKFGYLGCLIVGTLATLQAINTYSLAAETPEIQQHPTATKKSNTQIIPKTNKTAKQKSANKPEDDLLGIWSTHYQQTFITVIINADRTAQFLLIDQGHSIGTVTWRPAPNGLIVDGLPMLRFWKSKNKEYARVLLEELPP